MSGAVDIHEAVASLWESSELNTLFQSYWDADDRDYYPSLNDEGGAAPGTPFPYAVIGAPKPDIRIRMSSTANEKLVIKDQTWRFDVFAKQTAAKSAKEQASYLADEIMKVFGGHPTQSPTEMTLDNGSIINVKYTGDYGVRVDNEIHQWTVEYTITTDVPIMV